MPPPTKDDQRAALEERRLRSVYDFFDNSYYKRALQDCDKIIKKYGSKMGPTVYALKALALTKLSRWPEANKLMDDLIKEQPIEDSALSPLVIALRDAERHAEVIPLYEAACRRAPPNEELLNSLFMLYVRERERTKAKNIALQLHKLTDKRPYFFTAVMHQYLSGKESGSGSAEGGGDDRQRTMCFTLAEKMLERMPPSADAELSLQYMILRDSGKSVEALEFLDRHADKLQMLEIAEERWSIFERTQDWDRAAEEAEAAFVQRKCEDHVWLARRFDVGELRNEQCAEVGQKLIALIEQVDNHDRRRELLINKMLVYKRLGNFAEVEQRLVAFYQCFASRSWCVADVRYLAEDLPSEHRASLVKRLSEVASDDSLTWLMIDFELGPVKSDDAELAMIDRLCKTYAGGPALERESDTNPLDGYLELAADIAVARFRRCRDEHGLLRIVDELEQAKQRSPNGFRLKLRLLWCYCAMNAGLKVVAMCDSLNIKYLQWESLGYLISPYVLRSSFAGALALYRKLVPLHASSQKDIAEGIVSCYKFGSFHKVEEMESLKPRLENSFELANAKVMRALLACTIERFQAEERGGGGGGSKPEGFLVPSVAWDRLRDNCDMALLPKHYHYIFASFETKKRELKLRWLVLRLLTALADDDRSAAMAAFSDALSAESDGSALQESHANAFAYYIAPLATPERVATERELLAKRTESIADVRLDSLHSLSCFAVRTFEWALALSCMTVFALHSADAGMKRAVLEEIAKLQKMPFCLDAVFTGDSHCNQALRDDFETSWSTSLAVLKGAEKMLKC